MDKIEAGEANMDTKALDGREAVVEMVREARADAAEDRFFTNRANMDMADRVISIVALVFGVVCVCALLAHVPVVEGFTLRTTTRENHHKGACPFVVVFVFERGAGR